MSDRERLQKYRHDWMSFCGDKTKVTPLPDNQLAWDEIERMSLSHEQLKPMAIPPPQEWLEEEFDDE